MADPRPLPRAGSIRLHGAVSLDEVPGGVAPPDRDLPRSASGRLLQLPRSNSIKLQMPRSDSGAQLAVPGPLVLEARPPSPMEVSIAALRKGSVPALGLSSPVRAVIDSGRRNSSPLVSQDAPGTLAVPPSVPEAGEPSPDASMDCTGTEITNQQAVSAEGIAAGLSTLAVGDGTAGGAVPCSPPRRAGSFRSSSFKGMAPKIVASGERKEVVILEPTHLAVDAAQEGRLRDLFALWRFDEPETRARGRAHMLAVVEAAVRGAPAAAPAGLDERHATLPPGGRAANWDDFFLYFTVLCAGAGPPTSTPPRPPPLPRPRPRLRPGARAAGRRRPRDAGGAGAGRRGSFRSSSFKGMAPKIVSWTEGEGAARVVVEPTRLAVDAEEEERLRHLYTLWACGAAHKLRDLEAAVLAEVGGAPLAFAQPAELAARLARARAALRERPAAAQEAGELPPWDDFFLFFTTLCAGVAPAEFDAFLAHLLSRARAHAPTLPGLSP
eukprot:tig00020531_g10052.t1